jgi:DNA-binding response OmpR family regulator
MRLLIAEDDPALGRFLARGMEQDGHQVTMATDGEMAMEAARNDPPEMVVLDLNLPRRDGTEVLEFLRSLTEDVPILILTARAEPAIRLRCLEMGADDFMLKPFSFAELRARCRALLRRRSPGLVLRQGEVELKRVERSVTRNGKAVPLTRREFALLEYLMLHRGRPVSRATLLHVFLIHTPALVGRGEDIATLTGHCLERLGRRSPAKQITARAMAVLAAHSWPGNVRELEHVLERAWILAEDRPRIDLEEIELDEAQ